MAGSSFDKLRMDSDDRLRANRSCWVSAPPGRFRESCSYLERMAITRVSRLMVAIRIAPLKVPRLERM